MIKIIKENFITASLSVLMILITISGVLTFYNKRVMVENAELKRQTELVLGYVNGIFGNNIKQLDLGLRGYALTKEKHLLKPYNAGINDSEPNLDRIDSMLILQNTPDSIRVAFKNFRPKVKEYVARSEMMKELVDKDSLSDFVKLLKEDLGGILWDEFAPISAKVREHEERLIQKAETDYATAQSRNIVVQIILVLFSLPVLIGLIIRLKRDARERKALILEFERNNRRYMFDPGTELREDNPQIIIQSSIQNLKRASSFIKEISKGNYSASWEGLNDTNATINSDNLSGDLIKMRDQMKTVKEADEKRIWTTEGLSKFSDVARTNQDNIEKLSHEVVKFLSRYLNAQQASLFVLQEFDEEEPYLNLAACYAFDKKKFIEKRVDIGSGMVGQAYLEGTTTVLTSLPKNYINITSGLGSATPSCLIIVPMKYNEKVEAILELASFEKFREHEVQFLEKAGEVIASAIYSTKINERTSKLLKESQEQAETLKSQEEELRQNMEELQATQENMRRKQTESI